MNNEIQSENVIFLGRRRMRLKEKTKKKMRCFTFHINNKVPYGKLILLV